MRLFKNYELTNLNTFGLKSIASEFIIISSDDDFFKIIEHPLKKYFVLGGGSNVVLPEFYDGTVISISKNDFEIVCESENDFLVKSGAGNNWHNFVTRLIDNGIYGFENLALIPGNVGAAPIQNIGAYGIEQNKYFYSLKAFDLLNGENITMNADDCKFGYRNSYFKQKGKHLLISEVYYKFPKKWNPEIEYSDIKNYISNSENFEITPKSIFEAIVKIRTKKLPDPTILGNAGSFFKNPVIVEDAHNELIAKHPDLKGFPDSGNIYKISAAKLIEKAGWKGNKLNSNDGISVSPAHSLVLINTGGGTYQQIIELSSAIIDDILQKFGISLEREVNIIS